MTVCRTQIRLATPEDCQRISDLICPLTEKYIVQEFSAAAADQLLKSMSPEAIQQNMQKRFRYHVGETAGQLVGMAATLDNRHLYHLFVAEEFHRQGQASSLWEVSRRACLDNGRPEAFTVNSSLFAIDFYKKLGFVEISTQIEQNGVIYVPMRLALSLDCS